MGRVCLFLDLEVLDEEEALGERGPASSKLSPKIDPRVSLVLFCEPEIWEEALSGLGWDGFTPRRCIGGTISGPQGLLELSPSCSASRPKRRTFLRTSYSSSRLCSRWSDTSLSEASVAATASDWLRERRGSSEAFASVLRSSREDPLGPEGT